MGMYSCIFTDTAQHCANNVITKNTNPLFRMLFTLYRFSPCAGMWLKHQSNTAMNVAHLFSLSSAVCYFSC
uniref:Uncharacterized protein n=1 Tax=Anguilla anguilla TaxID=7936 RepID=A0A0E9RCM9_ANGAN